MRKDNLWRRALSPAVFMAAAMALAILAAALRPAEERAPAAPAPPPPPAAEEQPPEEARPEVPQVSIEVNIPATEMTLYEGGNPLFRRRIAIGSGVYPTPEQESAIRRIEWNPWWYPPPDAPWARGAKPEPPGPGNPLGLVKMPLSDAIMFHGTNKDWSVGHPASHGCMRMHNREVTAIAWYLQERFSEKADPALLELYRRNRGTTYPVTLTTPVPVRLSYRPVVARDDVIAFYPDHYHRVAGRQKAAVVMALLRGGYELSVFDDAALARVAKEWPSGREVPLSELLHNAPRTAFSPAPGCD